MKQNRPLLRISYGQFVGHWFLATLLAWFVAPALYVAITIAGLFIFGLFDIILGGSIVLSSIVDTVFMFLLMLGGGALAIGTVIGSFQRNIVRRQLHTDLERWKFATILGSFLGIIMTGIILLIITPITYDGMVAIALAMPIFITCIASVQYLWLRRSVDDAWLWILSNLVSGLVFAKFAFGQQLQTGSDDFEFLSMLMGIALQSFIMAHTMAYLIEHRTHPSVLNTTSPATQTAKEPAIVVVNARPRSVWDEAI